MLRKKASPAREDPPMFTSDIDSSVKHESEPLEVVDQQKSVSRSEEFNADGHKPTIYNIPTSASEPLEVVDQQKSVSRSEESNAGNTVILTYDDPLEVKEEFVVQVVVTGVNCKK